MDNDIRSNTGATSTARDKVRDKAVEVAGMAKEQIASQYDHQKERAMNEVEHLASALRRAGENLRDQGNSSIGAAVLSRAATQLDSLGGSLQGKDLDGLVRDVERLARRNPAAFIGGAMLIGFAASRFLKASSPSMGNGYGFDSDSRDLAEFGTDSRSAGFAGAGYGSTGLGNSAIGTTPSTGIGSTGRSTIGTSGTGTAGTTRPSGTRRPGGGNSGSSGNTGGL